MSFLHQSDALQLRLASRACRDAVAEHGWNHLDLENEDESDIVRNLATWRRCFPHAMAVNLAFNEDVTDDDLALLRGMRSVRLDGCTAITDAGLAHLRGIYELSIVGCTAITDAGLA